MKEELKIQIVNALESWMELHPNVSQNDIASNADVNASYLIGMRKRDFNIRSGARVVSISEKYFLRVARFIGFEVAVSHWETRTTIQLKDVLTSLSIAKENSETTVIIGETGCGKTYSLDTFKNRFPTEVFVVKVGSSDNLRDLIAKVLSALKIAFPGYTSSARLGQIALKLKILKEQGLMPMLVFDEAEYMKHAALCAFKELYDMLHRDCALVLIGTGELLTNIDKLLKSSKPGIAQLFRRIKFKIHELPAIDRRFEAFLKEIDEPTLKKWLQQNCENYGELHDVLVPVLKEAKRTQLPVDLNLIKTVLGI
jgi:DNA transposition AAA+ family ATPase